MHSCYIFCPLGVIRDPKSGALMGPTVGPAQHIAVCMVKKCECSALTQRINEFKGIGCADNVEGGENENDV